jgi:hypothetical protein
MQSTFSPETIVTLEQIEEWLPDDHRILALKQVYERALKKFEYNHRVTNALLLILNGHIVSMYSDPKEHPESPEWVFKIRSQTNPNVVFTVKKSGCNCVDAHTLQSKSWCKHRLARAMVLRTQQVIAYRTKDTV